MSDIVCLVYTARLGVYFAYSHYSCDDNRRGAGKPPNKSEGVDEDNVLFFDNLLHLVSYLFPKNRLMAYRFCSSTFVAHAFFNLELL